MEDQHTNLIARDDTFFGVCQGIGDDFGFNPLWLRVVLSVLLLWNPQAVIGAYFALGAAVLLSRLIFPNPRAQPVAEAPAAAPAATLPAPAPAPADKVGGQLLPLAA